MECFSRAIIRPLLTFDLQRVIGASNFDVLVNVGDFCGAHNGRQLFSTRA